MVVRLNACVNGIISVAATLERPATWHTERTFRMRSQSTCTVESCDRAHYGHGWCAMHYQRWRKHGDPTFTITAPHLMGGEKLVRTLEANRAMQAVHRTIQRGDLVRPSHCSRCGKEVFAEAAHHDYARPLDVEWLCRSCHMYEDAKSAKGGTLRLSEQRLQPRRAVKGLVHGTHSGYTKHACRCVDCKAAMSAYQRAYKARRKAAL